MKKLSLKKLNLGISDLLQRNQLKTILGGADCNGCVTICYVTIKGGIGGYGYGNCSEAPSADSCSEYCCEAGQDTYWC